MQAEVVARKWGNSIGVTLPKELVEKEQIKENEKIVIEVHKTKPLLVKDIFGLAKGWKFDTQKFKDELREADLERDRKLSRLLRAHRNNKGKSKL